MLIIIEKKIDMHNQIQSYTKANKKSSIRKISIPKHNTINWNRIQKQHISDQWGIIYDKYRIE